MPLLSKIQTFAEQGFAEAISSKEDVSKKYFMKILLAIENESSDINASEEAPKNTNEEEARSYDRIDDPEKVNTVAYFLSKYGHENLFSCGDYNQSNAISEAAKILGVKKHTLRNLRDTFDSYTDSPREGWKKPLNPVQQEVFEKMEDKSFRQVKEIISEILEPPRTFNIFK